MISPKHAGYIMIVVALILLALSAAAPALAQEDMEPGYQCHTEATLEQLRLDAWNHGFHSGEERGKVVGYQEGYNDAGTEVVDEILDHLEKMCGPDGVGMVEFRNGVTVVCVK